MKRRNDLEDDKAMTKRHYQFDFLVPPRIKVILKRIKAFRSVLKTRN